MAQLSVFMTAIMISSYQQTCFCVFVLNIFMNIASLVLCVINKWAHLKAPSRIRIFHTHTLTHTKNSSEKQIESHRIEVQCSESKTNAIPKQKEMSDFKDRYNIQALLQHGPNHLVSSIHCTYIVDITQLSLTMCTSLKCARTH